MTRRTHILLLALGAVAQVCAVHLTAPTIFQGVDFVRLHLLNRLYLSEALRAGRLPLWNPHVGLGRPFLADIEVGAFYIPNLLVLPMGPTVGLAVSAVLHAALVLGGMTGLSRHLGMGRGIGALMGFAFLTGAPIAGRLQAGQVPYAHATCYLPLLFLLAARVQDFPTPARVAQLACALGLQLLCGHPQIAWIAWTGLGFFMVGRGLQPPFRAAVARTGRDLAALALALLGGLGLAAVQLLPFMELVGQGNRPAHSMDFAAAGAMAPSSWISLLVPVDPLRAFYWETNLYAGTAVALAGFAGLGRIRDRDVRGLAVVALAAALIASGPLTPAFRLFHAVIPGLASFHIPSRTAVLVFFALVVAAGKQLSMGAPARWWAGLWTIPAALCATAWWVLSGPVSTGTGLAAALIKVGAVGTLLAAWRYRERWCRARVLLVGGLLLAIGVGDMVSATAYLKKAYYVGVDPTRRGERVVDQVLRQAGLYGVAGIPPRVSIPSWVIRDNSGMAHGYSTYSGYVALSLDRVWTYIHRAVGLIPSHAENTYPAPAIFRVGPFPYRSMNLVLGFDPRTGDLVVNPAPDPRAYVVQSATALQDWHEALERAVQGHDIHRSVLLEGGAPGPATEADPGSGGRAQILEFAPEKVVVETVSDRPGWLVLAEPWYPGWQAWVNGTQTRCAPANVWMRAVAVPAGRSEVVLRFSSRLLPAGAVLSLGSAALLVLAARRR